MKLAIGSLLVAGAAAFAPASTSRVSSSALNLAVGEVAPDFALVDQNGKTVKRSSFKKPLVVYFYPADSTPGCTVQATEFNEQIKDIATCVPQEGQTGRTCFDKIGTPVLTYAIFGGTSCENE